MSSTKKEFALMTAMALGMAVQNPSVYDKYFGGEYRSSRRKVTKCSECSEFGRKCPTRKGEMKPCSKYR